MSGIKRGAYYSLLKIINKIQKIIKLPFILYCFISFFPIDKYIRYKKTLKLINMYFGNRKNVVLEIGAGCSSPIVQMQNAYVILLDINMNPFLDLIASATHLPFKGSSFNTTVAIDVIEHIPKSLRANVLKEMSRVSKEMVIIHAPLEDGKKFLGMQCDLIFNEWHFIVYGKNDTSTSEHLLHKIPSPHDFYDFKFQLFGSQNAELWLKCMFLQHLSRSIITFPYISLMAYFYYLLKQQMDCQPPFWGGVFNT